MLSLYLGGHLFVKMKTVINIKERETAIKSVDVFRKKKYENKDIRFTNVFLRQLNTKVRKSIFYKNDLYIGSDTLWDIMQEQGGKRKHNYHGLSAADIIDALLFIAEPYYILLSVESRYLIITETITHFGKRLFMVIEVGAGTYENEKKNINKIVTMYSMNEKKIEKKIQDNCVIYKKMNTDTGPRIP